jgi:sugar lactone lactonase YvrE
MALGKVSPMNPEVVTDVKAVLGEGPSWDSQNQVLYWVDIINGLILIHKPDNPADKSIKVGIDSMTGNAIRLAGSGLVRWTCLRSAPWEGCTC